MRISMIGFAVASAMLAVMPAAANEPWHLAPGDIGSTYHPDHVTSQGAFRQKFDSERQAMAAKGYSYDLLWGVYRYTGRDTLPAAAPGLTREQVLAREADEKREMAAKGYRWSQLYGTYQRVGP